MSNHPELPLNPPPCDSSDSTNEPIHGTAARKCPQHISIHAAYRPDLDELIKSSGDLDFLVNAAAAEPDPVIRERAFNWLLVKSPQLARFAKGGQIFPTHSTTDLGATVTRRIIDRVIAGLRFNNMEHLHNYLRVCVKNRIRQIVRRRVYDLMEMPGRLVAIGNAPGEVDPPDKRGAALSSEPAADINEHIMEAFELARSRAAEPKVIDLRHDDPPVPYDQVAREVGRTDADCRKIYQRFRQALVKHLGESGLDVTKMHFRSGEPLPNATTPTARTIDRARAEQISQLTGLEMFVIGHRLELKQSLQDIAYSTGSDRNFCRGIVMRFLQGLLAEQLSQSNPLADSCSEIAVTLDDIGIRIARALGQAEAGEEQYRAIAGEVGVSPEQCREIHTNYRLAVLEKAYASFGFNEWIDVRISKQEKDLIELREADGLLPVEFDQIARQVGLPVDLCMAVYSWYSNMSDQELARVGYD